MRRRLIVATLPLAALLAGPSAAGAIQVNESFKPQNAFKLDPYLSIHLGKLDLSINKAVVYLLLAGIFTVLTMVWIARRMQARPNRVQTVVETLYGFARDNITRGNMERRMSTRWFAFIATLFIFLLWSNIISYVPLPTNIEDTVNVFGVNLPTFSFYAATGNLGVTLVLTLVVWVAYHVEGIRARGPINYVRSFIPAGVTGFARIPIFMIETLSHFIRIISLSVRLYANLLAGHLLILFMGGGLAVLLGSVVVGVITLPVAIAFFLFEVVLIAGLQAFIFATLTAIYLGGATAEH